MEKYGKPFKELDRDEKLWYLWEYYRLPALGIIGAVVLIAGLLFNILRPRVVNEVDISIIGGLVTSEELDHEMERYKTEFNTGLFITALDWEMPSELVMVMQQKMMVMLQAEELDILVLPKKTFERNVRNSAGGMFIPLDEIPELKELLKSQELITTSDVINDLADEVDSDSAEELGLTERNDKLRELEEHVWGIQVSKLDHMPSIVEHEEMVIGITTAAKDVTKAANMVDYLVP